MSEQAWSFPPSFSRSAEGVRMKSGEADIEQSVRILLGTWPGERHLEPEYGFDWNDLLFEPGTGMGNSVFNPEYLLQRLGDALTAFEPRVELKEVDVQGEPHDGRVNIVLLLRVKESGRYLRVDGVAAGRAASSNPET